MQKLGFRQGRGRPSRGREEQKCLCREQQAFQRLLPPRERRSRWRRRSRNEKNEKQIKPDWDMCVKGLYLRFRSAVCILFSDGNSDDVYLAVYLHVHYEEL